jgi:drug/metabolite transporter (DMT)-like permease
MLAGTSRNKKPEGIGWRSAARRAVLYGPQINQTLHSGGALVFKKITPHLSAVLQALFVTFLWSTSWVLIKIGLRDIPALTFAGLRYSLAFICLLPLALQPAYRVALRQLTRVDWQRLVLLGLLVYTLTQGTQFVALAYLPAVSVNLILNFTPIIVAFLGVILLAERPTRLQMVGVVVFLAGNVLYFYPASFPASQWIGLAAVIAGLFGNAISSVLGRHVNQDAHIPAVIVTVTSMGIGSFFLLGTGIALQGLPSLSLTNWAIIGWLALVNSAFAFTLWNHTLRTLPAMESSIINSTMLVQIAILAWLFLGEGLTLQKIVGMCLAGLGAVAVQLRRSRISAQGQAAIISRTTKYSREEGREYQK